MHAGEIGIVLYPGVQAASVQGLTDLFGIATSIARRDVRSSLRVTHWQPAKEAERPSSGNVVDLMEALKRSIGEGPGPGKAKSARSGKKRA
jgi:transcriptional regulator GlxA family with amidase domain